MKTLIVTDVHGNLPALEAILATAEAQACRDVISLGDHTCFCAQSREVHQRLISLGATLLTGNHEQRLCQADHPAYAAYNWAPMRWTARQLQGLDLHFPTDLHLGSIHFTHATPGDPTRLVSPEEMAALLPTLPAGTLLITGHNHIRWDVRVGDRRAVNPGSAGLAEDGRGGVAPFAVLDTDDARITLHEAPYRVADTLRAFITTGMHRSAPEISRAVARVLQTGEYQGVLKLMRHVHQTATVAGLDPGSQAAWRLADASYPWAEPVTSPEYWSQLEESL